jgi:hypothetical protein
LQACIASDFGIVQVKVAARPTFDKHGINADVRGKVEGRAVEIADRNSEVALSKRAAAWRIYPQFGCSRHELTAWWIPLNKCRRDRTYSCMDRQSPNSIVVGRVLSRKAQSEVLWWYGSWQILLALFSTLDTREPHVKQADIGYVFTDAPQMRTLTARKILFIDSWVHLLFSPRHVRRASAWLANYTGGGEACVQS